MKAWRVFGALAAMLALFAMPVRAQNATLFQLLNLDGATADTTAVGMADSSAIIFTGPYQRLYLDLKPSRPCRIAILIKTHGDSLGQTGAVANSDTSKTFIWPWRTISSTTSTPDTMLYKETILPTSVQGGSEELIVEFAADGVKKWSPPRGRSFAIRSPWDGTWYWGRFTSIRLRVLSASGVVTWKSVIKGVAW